MIFANKKIVNYDCYNLDQYVLDWYSLKNVSSLNIVTRPFNCLILCEIIEKLILINKIKILYLTWEKVSYNVNMKIANEFKNRNVSFKVYSHGEDNFINSGVLIANPIEFKNEDLTFDLVVYNDVSGISILNNIGIMFLLNGIKSNKKILCSVEKIFTDNVINISFPDKHIFVEPRIITTKVDLNKDIPFVIYEFLNWFIDNNRKVLIISKSYNSSFRIYSYLKNILIFSDKNLKKFTNNFDEFGDFMNSKDSLVGVADDSFIKKYNHISTFVSIKGELDILVFFAADPIFDFKKLISLCAISSGSNDRKEVIFLSNEESKKLINVKMSAREYNKVLWDYGSIKF